MARKPMVTRTITTTKVNVLCLDVESVETFNKVVTLPRTYKDNKKLLKVVEDVVNSDTVKAVHIVDKTEVETLYGMTEQDFITSASVLTLLQEKKSNQKQKKQNSKNRKRRTKL